MTAASPGLTLVPCATGRWHTRGVIVHWRLGASEPRDPSASARRWVEQIVRDEALFPWRGFAPDAPWQKPGFTGVDSGDDGHGPDFSVSHSGDALLVAVAVGGRVGVDVEAAPFHAFDSNALAARTCSPCESERLLTLGHEESRHTLAGVWTAKEAVTKASGRGLAVDFRTICVEPPAPRMEDHFVAHLAVLDDRIPVVVGLVGRGTSVSIAPQHTEVVGGPCEFHTPPMKRSHVCEP